MERHQRIQLKTTSRSTNQPFKVSPFQTRGFGVQQKAASTPASKAELWENYQRSSQMTQQGVGGTRSPIQAKLSIGQPGDKYEQEADSVADRVMAMSEPAQVQREELGEEEEELQMKPLAGTISPLVQREELPEEEEELQMKPEDNLVQREELPEEEEELQMKSLDNSIQREELPEEEEEIQMKEAATSNTPAATTSLEDRLSSSKGGGSPLSDDVRSFMEPRFGADFSGVRVHTGSDAVQMNQDVSAQAFAHGSDVYFGAGKAPGKDALTAHELTHVVQQTGVVSKKRDDTETTDNITKPSRYKIELKAWIPHSHVVDPEEPLRASDWLDTLTCIGPLKYSYSSQYRGDSHTSYDGGYRALSSTEFDYDGKLITGFSGAGSFGASHRDWKASASIFGKKIASGSGTASDTATSATSSSSSDKSFSLGIDSTNPLLMTTGPAINSELYGVFESSGKLKLEYNTDLFPSHGLRVYKDGVVIHTSVVNDASSVNALGVAGALHLGIRLSSHDIKGTTILPVGGVNP
jgi:Domain of unknown function (DUF4157)